MAMLSSPLWPRRRKLLLCLTASAAFSTTTTAFVSPPSRPPQTRSHVGASLPSCRHHCFPSSSLLRTAAPRPNVLLPLRVSTEEDALTEESKGTDADLASTAGKQSDASVAVTNGDTAHLSRGQQLDSDSGPAATQTHADAATPAFANLRETLFLGIEPTPEILAIMTIYFVEGALGLARLAQTFLLKDTLHLGPAEMSALTGIFTLPWTIKPLYGFLSDGFPLFGYKRRSYLVVAGLLGCLSYTALGADFWGVLGHFDGGASVVGATVEAGMDVAVGSVGDAAAGAASTGWLDGRVTDLEGTIAALLLSSACIAFSDVVADGIVVQRTRDSDDPRVAGGLQSLCWGSAALGGLLSAYFSGSLLEVVGVREVFQITAVLPFLVAIIALFVDEEPIGKSGKVAGAAVATAEGGVGPGELSLSSSDESPLDGVKDQVDALWSAIKQPAIWRPALFLFLWQSTPTGEGAMLYFMTNDLGFGPEFLGRARLVSAAAALVGVWGYQKFLRAVPVKDILFWTTIASAPLGLVQLLLITHANRSLGIPDGAFVLGDDVVLSILGEFAFLPTLVLAARLCPPGVEAVLFATLMSVFNGASTVGTEVGAALTKFLGITESNFDNLALLTIICNLTSLYPLLFIGWLDDVGGQSEEEEEDDSGGDEGGDHRGEAVFDVPTGSIEIKGEM